MINLQEEKPNEDNKASPPKKKKLRRHKKQEKVLTIACPSHSCQKPVQLLCPLCYHASLFCDEEFLILTCKHCNNTFHFFECPHCKFPIKTSYIQQKQRILHKLQENSDVSKFFAVISSITFIAFFIWLTITLYS